MKIAIIGAGPAGMMAAYRASKRGLDVTLYDPNDKLGRKLRITGKGRCNICNACEVKNVLDNITGDGRFLYSALSRFGPSDVMAFFEENNLPLKVERGNRVFPVSDNANDVADLMRNLCLSAGVRIIKKKIHSLKELDYDAVLLSTGGMSYPKTGSDGTGYELAKSAGHTIVSPRASLVPLESSDWFCKELQGFSPRNVVVRAFEDGKQIYKEMGEMLFTHFGVSGPLILSASAHFNSFDNARIEIDFKPALDDNKLDQRILRDFGDNSNKLFINYLPKLVGNSMAPVISSLLEIPYETKINEITHEQRARLRILLKSFPVEICGTRPIDEAIITRGGVDLKEVNPRTMQSKINPKLYFAGEILNLDAYTGGYNLQIAWSTGYVAGEEMLNDK